MSKALKLIATPASLAEHEADQMTFSGNDLTITDYEKHKLAELDEIACNLGFVGTKYFVGAARGVALPVSFEADQTVPYTNYLDATFEGNFITYSKVALGRLVGGNIIRALCLTFDNVTLLPYFDEVPSDQLFFTPVLVVDSMIRTAA